MADITPPAWAERLLDNLLGPVGQAGPLRCRLVTGDQQGNRKGNAMTDEAVLRQMASEARWNRAPDTLTVNGTEMKVSKPRTRFAVHADDGTELLRIEVTEDGMLDVSGPEDRWTEGAARFAAEMRRLLADD
jgi:hypothetical protein